MHFTIVVSRKYQFTFKDGSKLHMYPCVMLNADVHQNYTNDQYQTLVDKSLKKFETKSECSIFFEVDGPIDVWCCISRKR